MGIAIWFGCWRGDFGSLDEYFTCCDIALIFPFFFFVKQINGEFEAVQEALVHITTRLQHYFFCDAFPSINFPPNPAFLDQPPYPSFFGRRELSPPGLYSSYGPPFHKFDGVGIRPPHGGFHPHDDRALLMHNIPRFDGPTHISDRRHWGPQVYCSSFVLQILKYFS